MLKGPAKYSSWAVQRTVRCYLISMGLAQTNLTRIFENKIKAVEKNPRETAEKIDQNEKKKHK
jgi:hypothetical protein